MPKPRSRQVSLEATPYYHCVSRCVRRAFLCGTDQQSGQDYEHRRQWLEDKILELGTLFAIDVCAYAVMSNHYHIVLHIDQDQADTWDDREVIERWHHLFSGNLLSQRYQAGDVLSINEKDALQPCIDEWRKRLMDISWFMRVLNEQLARLANQEDQCTGRFWEGRFKSQALLDEAALMACLAYVDLNPIRAGMAKTPEASDHTSVKTRIQDQVDTDSSLSARPTSAPNLLMPFVGHPRQNMPKGLPFQLIDYLELVDWTGRIIREDKRGYMPQDMPPILERLNIEPKQWMYLTRHFESPFKGLVGSIHKLKRAGTLLGYRRVPGLSSCKAFFT